MRLMIAKRATVIILLLLTVPGGAFAQAGRLPRVGVLVSGSESRFLPSFREGMRALDYIEGRNYLLVVRAAEGAYDRLPGLVAELIEFKPDIIVTSGVPSALAAKRATTIPTIAVSVGDPVGVGLVTNLARPGGHITALSHFAADLSAKQVDVFKQAIPTLSRIAVLYNSTNPLHPRYWQETQEAAQALGVGLLRLVVRDTKELVHAIETLPRERGAGLLVLSDGFFNAQPARIAQLAKASRLPMMAPYREFVEAGGLLSYGPNLPEIYKRAAVYVDKILKGAKAGDLPVEQPTKLELIINLQTAKALGLTISASLMLRADQVIE